jgi:perosamine synthetase
MRIPLSSPDICEEDIEAVANVLRTPHLSLGPKLAEFERAIEKYLRASNAIAVNSGTAALHLCVRALGIGEGDEVIIPSFAFIAVANAIRYERAAPVFVDIEPETLNLDPCRVEAAITRHTKAIVAVHTFGYPADMDAILEIARRHQLRVIEDACEAIGADYKGRKAGTLGDIGVFGFYPNKQITTGEGGVVVTENAGITSLVRKLRNQGRDNKEGWFQHTEFGYNYRISEMNCALGIEQLKRIDQILHRRQAIAQSYDQTLCKYGHLKLPPLTAPVGLISWFGYVVRLGARFTEFQRDWIVEEMCRRGIGVGRYFAPIHLQPVYQREPISKVLPVTESVASRAIALPFFNRIQESEIHEVCMTLIDLVESSRRFDTRSQRA